MPAELCDVLPGFWRAEDQERGADELHGVGGPLAVPRLRAASVVRSFHAAAQQAGFPRNDDFNGPSQRAKLFPAHGASRADARPRSAICARRGAI
jgi:choline dehydrogenase-like flavoprotein